MQNTVRLVCSLNTYTWLISRPTGTFVRYGPNRVVMNSRESLNGSLRPRYVLPV